jgi:multimeric flavodoxin WrbA
MKVIAVNGSPRKSWNTATLLDKALEGATSVGASTDMVHLYDLKYRGCTSCFICKRKDNKHNGLCAMKDGLTDVLEKIIECNVLFLGSPIYLGNTAGAMCSFLERLLFPMASYDLGRSTIFEGKMSSGFIYTMNGPKAYAILKNYKAIFNRNKQCLQRLNGPSEVLVSYDTYQFIDYSIYKASKFDEKHKAKVKAKQFPIDCKKAFDLGARLAGSY